MEYFTMDSFGCDCPSNWAALCEFLNEKANELVGPDVDEIEELETIANIWADFCDGVFDDEDGFPGYEQNTGSQYEGYTYEALPVNLQIAAETFWEPGFDYHDPGFWALIDHPSPDFVYAVKKYDETLKGVTE